MDYRGKRLLRPAEAAKKLGTSMATYGAGADEEVKSQSEECKTVGSPPAMLF